MTETDRAASHFKPSPCSILLIAMYIINTSSRFVTMSTGFTASLNNPHITSSPGSISVLRKNTDIYRTRRHHLKSETVSNLLAMKEVELHVF
jgi:hypothetical protein